eukprot:6172925-Pleurochrysis_carterae.AAC.1
MGTAACKRRTSSPTDRYTHRADESRHEHRQLFTATQAVRRPQADTVRALLQLRGESHHRPEPQHVSKSRNMYPFLHSPARDAGCGRASARPRSACVDVELRERPVEAEDKQARDDDGGSDEHRHVSRLRALARHAAALRHHHNGQHEGERAVHVDERRVLKRGQIRRPAEHGFLHLDRACGTRRGLGKKEAVRGKRL